MMMFSQHLWKIGVILVCFSTGMLGAMDLPKTPSFKEDLEKIRPYLTAKKPMVGFQIFEEETSISQLNKINLADSCYDLDGITWYAQGTAKSFLDGFGGVLIRDFLTSCVSLAQRYDFEDVISFFVVKEDQMIKVAVMKPLYPSHLARQMLHEITRPKKGSQELLAKYNKEELRKDRLYQTKEELGETKKILAANLDKLIQRGSDLSDLQERTTQLAEDAEDFRIGAKKLNPCCWLF